MRINCDFVGTGTNTPRKTRIKNRLLNKNKTAADFKKKPAIFRLLVVLFKLPFPRLECFTASVFELLLTMFCFIKIITLNSSFIKMIFRGVISEK